MLVGLLRWDLRDALDGPFFVIRKGLNLNGGLFRSFVFHFFPPGRGLPFLFVALLSHQFGLEPCRWTHLLLLLCSLYISFVLPWFFLALLVLPCAIG